MNHEFFSIRDLLSPSTTASYLIGLDIPGSCGDIVVHFLHKPHNKQTLHYHWCQIDVMSSTESSNVIAHILNMTKQNNKQGTSSFTDEHTDSYLPVTSALPWPICPKGSATLFKQHPKLKPSMSAGASGDSMTWWKTAARCMSTLSNEPRPWPWSWQWLEQNSILLMQLQLLYLFYNHKLVLFSWKITDIMIIMTSWKFENLKKSKNNQSTPHSSHITPCPWPIIKLTPRDHCSMLTQHRILQCHLVIRSSLERWIAAEENESFLWGWLPSLLSQSHHHNLWHVIAIWKGVVVSVNCKRQIVRL